MGVAPLGLAFQDSVTEVRVTSVTSGLEGPLGIRFGSVGLPGCTATPNSDKTQPHTHLNSKHPDHWLKEFAGFKPAKKFTSQGGFSKKQTYSECDEYCAVLSSLLIV